MTVSTITFGRKAVILAVIVSVAAMFITSFVYRMNHPNLFVQVQQMEQARATAAANADHDHDGDGVQDHGAGADTGMTPPPGMGQGMGGMGQIKQYLAQVEANPEDVEALTNLGNAFLMMRAWDRAIDPLEKANALKPGNTDVLKAMGIAYFNKEDFVKASAAYDEILEIDPKDTLALFNLGVIFKYYFEKPEPARTYFEKVLEYEKDDAEIIKMTKQELEK
ncbi:tetratricopeptide repeat protein [Pseudodesulfovibrio sp.]|nr:tetratricopeptide repeat protein [Pseudodesulfovibrio sp.]